MANPGALETKDSHCKFQCLNLAEIEALLIRPTKIQTDGRETCVGIYVYFVLDIDKNGDVMEFGKHRFKGAHEK